MKELSRKQWALAMDGPKMFERAHRIVSHPFAHSQDEVKEAREILDAGLSHALYGADPDLMESIYLGLFHYPGLEISFSSPDDPESDDPWYPEELN